MYSTCTEWIRTEFLKQRKFGMGFGQHKFVYSFYQFFKNYFRESKEFGDEAQSKKELINNKNRKEQITNKEKLIINFND